MNVGMHQYSYYTNTNLLEDCESSGSSESSLTLDISLFKILTILIDVW